MKRNQIIQRWLQGIEDPQYDVFPKKKEGKYIVKLRDKPLIQKDVSSDNLKEMDEQTDVSENVQDEAPAPVAKPSPTSIRKQSKSQPAVQRASHESCSIINPKTVDSTINLEILEQLRSLGEEIRNDRFKKEQKQYIKHVVNKELSKPRIRSKYVPDLFPDDNVVTTQVTQQAAPFQQQEQQAEPDVVEPEQYIPQQPVFRSRIRR